MYLDDDEREMDPSPKCSQDVPHLLDSHELGKGDF